MTRFQPTIQLWDIDGTLLSSGGAGRRAMLRAFETVVGESRCGEFEYAGMTDRWIARMALENLRSAIDDALIDRVIAAYLANLKDELAIAEDCRPLPGILEALAASKARTQVAMGLGTGNVRQGAALKLGAVGLADQFAFGGFGCDSEQRAELLQRGAERGAEFLGVTRSACRTVVIGDTPKDIAAAQAIGAECIAVATGRYSVEELRAAGATIAVADLQDPNGLAFLLGT